MDRCLNGNAHVQPGVQGRRWAGGEDAWAGVRGGVLPPAGGAGVVSKFTIPHIIILSPMVNFDDKAAFPVAANPVGSRRPRRTKAPRGGMTRRRQALDGERDVGVCASPAILQIDPVGEDGVEPVLRHASWLKPASRTYETGNTELRARTAGTLRAFPIWSTVPAGGPDAHFTPAQWRPVPD